MGLSEKQTFIYCIADSLARRIKTLLYTDRQYDHGPVRIRQTRTRGCPFTLRSRVCGDEDALWRLRESAEPTRHAHG